MILFEEGPQDSLSALKYYCNYHYWYELACFQNILSGI